MLEKNVVLLTTVGVLIPSGGEQSDSSVLRADTNVESITDPKKTIAVILTKAQKEELLRVYRIANFKNIEEFLA